MVFSPYFFCPLKDLHELFSLRVLFSLDSSQVRTNVGTDVHFKLYFFLVLWVVFPFQNVALLCINKSSVNEGVLCKLVRLVGCFRCSSIPIGSERMALDRFTCNLEHGEVDKGKGLCLG